MSELPKLIIIVGETASGKSALAMEIAEKFGGEIICADSWTVRREVNIGTAKPSEDERKRIRHHLLDIVGPDEDFTAAVFKNLANQAITDIFSRGKLPIMVGGTGLYVDGVIYDYGFLPAGDRSDREELNQLSVGELFERIKSQGIELGDVDARNKRRLIRLIESNGQKPAKKEHRDNTLIIGIKTDKSILEQRIISRVDGMITAGLESEVRGLEEQYGWDCEALKGVGYAQWKGYFEGRETLSQTRQRIIKATLGLAKRQRTWFKRNKSIQWLDTPVNQTKIVDTITTFLQR